MGPRGHPIHSEPVLVIELDGIIAKKPEFDGDRAEKTALLEVKEGKMRRTMLPLNIPSLAAARRPSCATAANCEKGTSILRPDRENR